MASHSAQVTSAERFILRALVLSLLIHFTVYGTWKVGEGRGWWRNLTLPAWMQLTPKMSKALLAKKVPSPLEIPPSQLVFVDVDPALATPEPPKTPKYYSANNSFAGNPVPRKALTPEIRGRQNKVVKTTENAKLKAQPLKPTPKQKEIAKTPPAKPLPRKNYTPGDMAMAKPTDKPQNTNAQAAASNDEPAPTPVHRRPRTLAEARAEHGMTGEKSRQAGGVARLSMESTTDAAKTAYGDYDREFIDTVQSQWERLLEKDPGTVPGKVVIEFRLYPDGRVSDLNVVENGVTDLLATFCQQAISDPAPYRPWPLEMRRDFPANYRDVRFTFYYSEE